VIAPGFAPSPVTTGTWRLAAAGALLVVLLIGSMVVRDRSTQALHQNSTAVGETHAVINALDRVLTSAVDAETGERGFLITGREEYLQPYNAAVSEMDGRAAHLSSLVSADPAQAAAAAALRTALAAKQQQLRETIEVYRAQGPQAAVALIMTGRSKAAMDAIRVQVRAMQTHQAGLLSARAAQAERTYARATWTGRVTGALGVLMTLAFAWSVRRNQRQQAAAAAALYGQREQLRVTLSSIGDGVIVTDPQGRVTMLNRVTEQLTGWLDRDATGRPLPEVFNIINEQTREPVDNPVVRALRDGTIVGLANHTVLIARDGSERPIADSAAPIRGADDVVLGAVLVFRDVSDERQAEIALNHALAREQSWAERLRHVANASLTINAATTQDSIVGVIDSEARRILGVGRCRVVFDTAEAAEKDGSLIVALKNRSGRQMGYIECSEKTGGVFDDDDRAVLTQMAQMAAIALENSNLYNEIRTSDLRKDEFLATLAHELRNPLAPISNTLQAWRTAGDVPHLADSRAVLERQVGQLVHLVDDLLDVSRVSRGKLDLRRRRVQLSEVLHAAIETTQPAVNAEGHTLQVHQPVEQVWLDADLTRLAQVFANLLHNSAKYMEPGGTITVDASATEQEVIVSVRDTGIGISREMLPHIFDMFVQADRSLERAKGGLGIGLTLVRRLVELHNGSVTARSDGPGKGSEFIVRLPRATPASEASEPVNASAEGAGNALPTRRVLVVDDNKDAVDSLGLLLSMVGQTVATARDGLEALSQFDAFAPDVVVLDIGLPRLNGYEVARRIRATEHGRRVILVALTGWGQDDDRRRTIEAGFDHHLVKPVDFDALKALLASLSRR